MRQATETLGLIAMMLVMASCATWLVVRISARDGQEDGR